MVEPPEDSNPGDKVFVASCQGDPVPVLKKDAFDLVAQKLKTSTSLVACFDGAALSTATGVCKVRTLTDASIH